MDRFGAPQGTAASAGMRLPPQQPQSAAEKASAWLDTQPEPAAAARKPDSLYPDFRCRAFLSLLLQLTLLSCT